MLIDEMHYEFDLRLDRVASQDRPDFYDNEKDAYLNRAIEFIIQKWYGTDNPKKTGFETNQERISNLMTLHIEYPVQQALTPTLHAGGKYEIRLRDLIFPYLFLTSARVIIEKDKCTKTIDHTNWQIDDRKNTFNEPSYDWSRVHANFGRSTLPIGTNDDLYSIYFDTTDYKDIQQFNINSVQLSYIKQPDRVCLGTYIHIDDKVTVAPANSALVNCDIHQSFHDDIIDQAVLFAFKDVQDQFGYQSSQQIVKNND
jgi:hypothetical protein